MKYVGADLHKKTVSLCVVEWHDRTTRVVGRKRLYCDQADRIGEFLATLGEFRVTVEATIGYDWFAALAEPLADRVVIAHPTKLRVIADSTRKSDKIDAQTLADFLAHDILPEAWRATPRTRQYRSLVRRRQKVQNRITGIKTTIRALLTRYNADRQDLFTKVGRLAMRHFQDYQELVNFSL